MADLPSPTDDARYAGVRTAFPVLSEVTYLNTGTVGIMAEPVLQQWLAVVARLERGGVAALEEVTQLQETGRVALARLLNVAPQELALTGNATDGINLAASSLPEAQSWTERDEVLLSDQEHPAMVVPWTYRMQLGGAAVRRFHVALDPEETLANARAATTERTRLVSFSLVTSQAGARLPAAAICAAAHAVGALAFVDGTQAVGQLEVDVPSLGCDFFTSNGHKWLGAAKGTGLFWAPRP